MQLIRGLSHSAFPKPPKPFYSPAKLSFSLGRLVSSSPVVAADFSSVPVGLCSFPRSDMKTEASFWGFGFEASDRMKVGFISLSCALNRRFRELVFSKALSHPCSDDVRLTVTSQLAFSHRAVDPSCSTIARLLTIWFGILPATSNM